MLERFSLRIAFAALVMAAVAQSPSLAQAEDVKPIRALLVIGGCCHDYATQKELLAKGISERAHVEVVIAYDPDKSTEHLNPVYENANWAEGFDVIIHDECSANVKDLNVIDRIIEPHRQGLPAVMLHCAMHCYRSEGYPKAVTPWFELTGLQSTGHGRQAPIDVTYLEHDITKSLANWTTINEELYNNFTGRLLDTASPLASGTQVTRNNKGEEKTDEAVVVWTNMYRDQTRVFSTSLGHNNETAADARYLDLVTRGLLWSCDKLNDKYLK